MAVRALVAGELAPPRHLIISDFYSRKTACEPIPIREAPDLLSCCGLQGFVGSFDEITAEATSDCLHGVDQGMNDWDHERAQDEDPVADEEPHEFGIHDTTVETGYRYDYGLLPSVLLRLCAGATKSADHQCWCPSVRLRPCADITKLLNPGR
jgi:hypothetical protein